MFAPDEQEPASSGRLLRRIWHASGPSVDASLAGGGADVGVYFAERGGPRAASSEWAYPLLHQLLVDLGHVGRDKLQLARRACSACGGLHGKPILPTVPRLSFNLSRRGRGLLIAVGVGVEVGVDLEELRSDWTNGDEAFVLSGAELAQPELEVPLAEFLTRQWTRKEAYLKGTGDGLNVEMSSVHIRRPKGPAGSIFEAPQGWCVRDLKLDVPDYVGAIATAPRRRASGGRL